MVVLLLLRRTCFPLRCQHRVLSARATSTAVDKVKRLADGVLAGDRARLAEAITLVESKNPTKRAMAQDLLEMILRRRSMPSEEVNRLMPCPPKSFRIGLSGPPGAGKSTFLEVFGKFLTAKNHRVAVLAVDPSSSFTGGSLLGDKTRMTELSRDPNAYIRPSPTSGTLGGVAQNTSEAIVLCEAAGYDVIIVETVGVGQSEYAVADMVDMFALLIPPAGGDDLQGLKRGIIEKADLLVVSKADGDLLPAARRIQSDYSSALRLLRPMNSYWKPKVMRVSSNEKEGIDKLWEKMCDFRRVMNEHGRLALRRQEQHRVWLWNHIENQIMWRFQRSPAVAKQLPAIEEAVREGCVTPGKAAEQLLDLFLEKAK